ncbi:MAG: flagellar basal body L-ring protein FlgH [Dechloromonas sp.]|uniref:Flagellar L-ring protein n=1 Tax=Candidatus Dechloromonas phosphorivorans TaxID=2899244 RepID=A0A9D7LNR4_9RHOO|nr:flagellar basal body L-ring protein FlgH [Candidatus Dechloromonas phosphorivorans]
MTDAIISRRWLSGGLAAMGLLLLAACAIPPPINVHQPMTALAAPPPNQPPINGAIFQEPRWAGQVSYRANRLFEDRRANAVGDILTININETTAASKKSGSSASRNGTNNLSLAAESSGLSKVDATLAAKSAGTFAGKGDSASNNAFTGVITVTVIEVLPNGNLLVSGEKQIGINQGSEFVRFSGVVNPLWLTPANAISSTRVADARLEYRGNGYVDEAQTMGWLSRFFLSVLPF